MIERGRIIYVELKSGHADNGPAWITRAQPTKSGRGIRFRDRLLLRGNGVSGNFFDEETGEEYWVSGVKENAQDRHRAGGGPVEIDEDVRQEYQLWLAGEATR